MRESWTLESGIQLKKSGIQATDRESGIQHPELGIHDVEYRIQEGLGLRRSVALPTWSVIEERKNR